MTEAAPHRIDALAPQLDGLEAAAESLDIERTATISVRRIGRALESSARRLGVDEIADLAAALQAAPDPELEACVRRVLSRAEALRELAPVEATTLLLVEDDADSVATLRRALARPGRTLLLAADAAEATAHLQRHDLDLVVLDLILPDRDGRDLLVELRERPHTAAVPVIVVTSHSGASTRAECLAVGADEVLEKPVDLRALRSMAARHIRIGRERRDIDGDGVTGLPNRLGFTREYARIRTGQETNGEPISLTALRIDALAEVTMRLGRAAGDRFLLEVCAALHEALGSMNPLGRWERAELVALFPGIAPEAARRIVTDALRALMRSEVLEEFRAAGIDPAMRCGVTLLRPGQSLRAALSTAEGRLRSVSPTRPEPSRTTPGRGPRSRPTILLVEDDRVTSTLIDRRLTREGYGVSTFGDGSEAFAWTRSHPFDLAILDVKIPGIDGFELLGRLRATPALATTPIIMLTGMGSEADVLRGLELGADDYMLKPFSPDELLQRVRRLMHARTRSAQRVGDERAPRSGESRT